MSWPLTMDGNMTEIPEFLSQIGLQLVQTKVRTETKNNLGALFENRIIDL
jgi:hypothetical protein